MMEPMVGMVFREERLEVLLPAPGDSLASGQALIVEINGIGSQLLLFELSDNKGWVKLVRPVTEGRAVWDAFLPPGLYYWKLKRGNELVYLGKVIVCRPSRSP